MALVWGHQGGKKRGQGNVSAVEIMQARCRQPSVDTRYPLILQDRIPRRVRAHSSDTQQRPFDVRYKFYILRWLILRHSLRCSRRINKG